VTNGIEPAQAPAPWAKGILLLTLSRRASGRRHGLEVRPDRAEDSCGGPLYVPSR